MDVVLGVAMTPAAVRMVLVEGENADGVTVDYESLEESLEGSGAARVERVLAGICGTRAGAVEDGHRVSGTGVVWTDYAAAVELRAALRARDIDGVTLVSELHAASALARAVGQTAGWNSTALMLLDRDTATLAVVRTVDGAVTRVQTRGLRSDDDAGPAEMVTGLDDLADAPGAVFVVGSEARVAALRPILSAHTALPVHAPADAEAALARGAALAAANAPRFDATTVGLLAGLETGDDTQPAPELTHPAGVGYCAPLAYSWEPADGREGAEEPPTDPGAAEQEPLLLLGSAAMAVFVVGMVSLVVALAVSFGPGSDPRGTAGFLPRGSVQTTSAVPAAPPETIQAPVPVVREAPRTVFVTPAAPAPVLQRPAAVPAAPPAAPPAPAAPPVPAAPAPVPAPAPVVVPIPIPVPVFAPLPAAPPAAPPAALPTPVRSATATPSSAPVSAPVTTATTASETSEASATATVPTAVPTAVPSAPTPAPAPEVPAQTSAPLILPSESVTPDS